MITGRKRSLLILHSNGALLNILRCATIYTVGLIPITLITYALNSWINPYHPQGINNELLSQTNTKIIILKGKIRKDKL
jgi:hypothetical protein